jgi:hypothetical protein
MQHLPQRIASDVLGNIRGLRFTLGLPSGASVGGLIVF